MGEWGERDRGREKVSWKPQISACLFVPSYVNEHWLAM